MFTNFSYTGSIAASLINVSFQSNGPVPAGASIAFQPTSGSWTAASISWTTAIDAAVCANCQFLAVLDQIGGPPTPNSNAGTFTHTPGGVVNVNGSAPGTLSGQANIAPGVVSIATNFTQTGGTTLQSVQSTFSQFDASIPEPTSFALMGIGLIGLGLLRRKLS
ncbi:MAG: PEP-CTERM sorting domain-containing protein [Acidobacteria bacterium]|nr:PEP-CTERM sorting domain-containing protein [Acidobacteriota bacterium]